MQTSTKNFRLRVVFIDRFLIRDILFCSVRFRYELTKCTMQKNETNNKISRMRVSNLCVSSLNKRQLRRLMSMWKWFEHTYRDFALIIGGQVEEVIFPCHYLFPDVIHSECTVFATEFGIDIGGLLVDEGSQVWSDFGLLECADHRSFGCLFELKLRY